MKYKIHFEHKDGTEDSFIVSGETIEDIRTRAKEESDKRGGVRSAWSEQVAD